MSRPSAIYWAYVAFAAAIFLVFCSQLQRIEDAQEEARQAIEARERYQTLAELRQRQVELLEAAYGQLLKAYSIEATLHRACQDVVLAVTAPVEDNDVKRLKNLLAEGIVEDL